jgi:hypothetical protein
MSLVVGTIADDTALVLVDTDAAGIDAAMGAVKHQAAPKLHTLFLQRAVITGRGPIAVIATAHHFATCAMVDFDALAEAMPLLCRRAWLQVAALATYVGNPPLGPASIHLVGWSRAAQRMRAYQYTMAPDVPVFGVASVEPRFAAPIIEGERLEFGLPSMKSYARAQIRWIRERFPDEASGGPLICATITRDTIALSDVGVVNQPTPATRVASDFATVAGAAGWSR